MRHAMTAHGFTLFDTTIGSCGIAWDAHGVVGVQLPESREAATRARVLRRFPEAREAPPPPDVQRALDGIVALLRGEPSDLSAVALDMDRVPPFHRRVYEVARTISPGTTLSYGEIAAQLGAPGAGTRRGAGARDVTRSRSWCRAIVCSPPAARSAASPRPAASTTKLRLLAIERAAHHARVNPQLGLFDGTAHGPRLRSGASQLRTCVPPTPRSAA